LVIPLVLLVYFNITYRGGVGRLGKGGGLELGTWIGLDLGRSVLALLLLDLA